MNIFDGPCEAQITWDGHAFPANLTLTYDAQTGGLRFEVKYWSDVSRRTKMLCAIKLDKVEAEAFTASV